MHCIILIIIIIIIIIIGGGGGSSFNFFERFYLEQILRVLHLVAVTKGVRNQSRVL
jgi:hypothetical protein